MACLQPKAVAHPAGVLHLLLHSTAEHLRAAILGVGDEVVVLVLEPVLTAKRKKRPAYHDTGADLSAVVNVPDTVNRCNSTRAGTPCCGGAQCFRPTLYHPAACVHQIHARPERGMTNEHTLHHVA